MLHVQLFAHMRLFGYSQFAHASICMHVMFGYSRVPIWDIKCHKTQAVDIPNQNLGVSEHHAHANRSMCKLGVSKSRACANSCMCNMCTLGQVWSGPVYYTIQRLPSTLFLFPRSSHLYASFLILTLCHLTFITLHHLTFRQCVVDCI